MNLDFHASERPTLGVEWEFALVDKGTRDLVNSASELFETVLPKLAEPDKLHKELLRNTVEVVTGVCDTVAEAMADLRATLDVVLPAADSIGVDLFGAGTHPFAAWSRRPASATSSAAPAVSAWIRGAIPSSRSSCRH